MTFEFRGQVWDTNRPIYVVGVNFSSHCWTAIYHDSRTHLIVSPSRLKCKAHHIVCIEYRLDTEGRNQIADVMIGAGATPNNIRLSNVYAAHTVAVAKELCVEADKEPKERKDNNESRTYKCSTKMVRNDCK